MCKKFSWCLYCDTNVPILLITGVPECRQITLEDVQRSGLVEVNFWRYSLEKVTRDMYPGLLEKLQWREYDRIDYAKFQELINGVVNRIAAGKRRSR